MSHNNNCSHFLSINISIECDENIICIFSQLTDIYSMLFQFDKNQSNRDICINTQIKSDKIFRCSIEYSFKIYFYP